MKKFRLWLVSSFVLILVVLVSSIYTIVYSAGTSQTSNTVFLFNYLSTEQAFGPVVTVASNSNANNEMINQTMQIAEKFTFCPESSATSEEVLFGESVLTQPQLLSSSQNFVIIPVRVTNNMVDIANARISFDNISTSTLKNITFYEVYNYKTGMRLLNNKLTDDCTITTTLERGKFIDLCVAVFVNSEYDGIINGVNSVNFNLQINLFKV